MVGQKIGHYLVLEKLGSGGMGHIYKAQDSRLNRMVAIKVLTPEGAGDPERRRRFTQEAQAASALNHPNIITIHDILSEDDNEYMVMEFVNGRTLADRIPKEGLGVAKTLSYGAQIADALRAAHAAGIVHRDLKPGNVMITDAGLVKVLDFGLAKLGARPLTEETQTLNAQPMTVEGSILGTVSYMSPEQAQGKRVDARSDIFSFGVLLYEMVTGQKAFAAESTISTIASILRDEAKPVSDLANGVPAELEEVIGRAMRKEPNDRWQSMNEAFSVLVALKQKFDSGILTHTLAIPPAATVTTRVKAKKPNPLIPVAAAVVLMGGAFTFWWVARTRPRPQPPRPVEVAIPAPQPVVPEPPPQQPPAPDANAAAEPSNVLTNADVISMVKEKVSNALIISQIRSSQTKFDLSAAEVIRLVKEGVPDRVIEVMRNPKAPAPSYSSGTGTSVKQTPAQPVTITPPQAATPTTAVTLPPPAPVAPVTAAAPPPVTSPPPSAAIPMVPVPVILVSVPAGLALPITLVADVPAGAEPGTPLRFVAARDLLVNGSIVVKQGAPVTGELSGAGKKILLMGGKVQFKLDAVTGVDGKKIKLRASPGRTSNKNEHAIEPPGFKSKELLAPSGSQYQGFIDSDQTVGVKK